MKRFHLSRSARRDLDEIFDYWAERAGLETADRIIESIAGRFALLGEYPLSGRRCEKFPPGVRRFPAGEYIIYYRKLRDGIEIAHVFRAARDQRNA